MSNAMLIDRHTFDYIALMINLGLTSCKDLDTVVDISLDNNYSACNISSVLLYRCMFGKIYLCLCRSHAWILSYSYTYTKCV